MLVFPDARIVLLAVPKTGTTALAAAFGPHAGVVLRQPPALKHQGLRKFDRTLRPLLERVTGGARFETVAVVREPVDWLGSWYRIGCATTSSGRRSRPAGWISIASCATTCPTPFRPMRRSAGSPASWRPRPTGASITSSATTGSRRLWTFSLRASASRRRCNGATSRRRRRSVSRPRPRRGSGQIMPRSSPSTTVSPAAPNAPSPERRGSDRQARRAWAGKPNSGSPPERSRNARRCSPR